MKKIYAIIVFGVLTLLFLFMNYNNIFNYYYNSVGKYSKTTNLEGIYNSGTLDLINKKYVLSNKSFSGVLNNKQKDLLKNKEVVFRTYHNLGNLFYKKDSNNIKNLEKSVNYYIKAIDLKTDEQTVKNLEFVKEKLRYLKYLENKKKRKKQEEQNNKQAEEKKKQEQKGKEESSKKQEKNNKNKKGDKSENKGDKSKEKKKGEKKNGKSEKKGSNKDGIETKDGKNKIGENKKSEKKGSNKDGESKEKGLSKNAKKALEKQLEKLKKEQSQIGEYYNKNYKPQDNRNDIFENFFNNTGFDNSLLDKVEKDW